MHADLEGLSRELKLLRPAFADQPAPAALLDLCRRFQVDVIRQLTDTEGEELCYAEDAARELVEAEITPDEALVAFRACAQAVWEQSRELARAYDDATYRALLERAGDIWLEYERWTSAMSAAYREAGRRRDQRATQEREAHVAALLTGAGGDQVELRRSADALELPKSGRFCVVVAERGELAGGRTPDPEHALRARGVQSAWRLTVDEQVGIVSLGATSPLSQVKETIRRADLGRTGMSPLYDQLAHTPLAARLAHVALRALPKGSTELCEYGDRPLETLVASAPETARDMAGTVLGALLTLPEADRRPLLHTLEVWCDAGGNINRTAELLFCHRNTVRHRLDRVEELTGRSLSEPRGIAETLMAVQAHLLHMN